MNGREQLPVASGAGVRRAAFDLIRADRRTFAAMLGLNALAAAAGLVGPRLLGKIIDTVQYAPPAQRAAATMTTVDRYALVIVACAVAQLILARFALSVGFRFGERTAARVREQFVDRALDLSPSVVDHVGTGDLAARGTGDITAVATTLRDAVPNVLIAAVQALFLIGAVVTIDPRLGGCGLLSLLVVGSVARWYLRRSGDAYLAQAASGSDIGEVLTATADGARTVEALGLQQRRHTAGADAIEVGRRTRTRTLFLRSVLFPAVDVSYVIPVVAVLLIGGALLKHHEITLGAIVTSAVYFRSMSVPLDAILLWIDQLQSSNASFARVEGLRQVMRPETTAEPVAEPIDERIDVVDARYAYTAGRDVLHGVNLSIRPGERLAVVGPSGAGKSTLGRLLAGIDEPRTGHVTVGGVPVAALPRGSVVLVTQEHHVFRDSIRDNLLIAAPSATDADLRAALAGVGAGWVDELPDALDTRLGPGHHDCDGAQAQQLALARVVLADPHTLVLDEATAMLDPTVARNTERALAAVMAGRTVIAIAHRLHTAHDADRVAVMEDGRVTELGTHDDLVANDGAYAALWHSWHGKPS
jgi:ATP-binding cassette, subfamily C, bacterial